MSAPNVVDSSAWLEYFAGTPRARTFAAAVEDADNLVVPVVCLLEVFGKVLREQGETKALHAVAVMQSGRVVPVDATLALDTARLALPLADSLIYATAQQHGAILWTQDEHFKDLPAVKFFAKK